MTLRPERSRRAGGATLALATLLTLVAGAGTAAGAAAPATTTATGADKSVVVILKDQLSATPATRAHAARRRTDATSAQGTVLNRLHGKAVKHLKHFSVGNAFSATVTAAQASQLAADPSVAAVVPNVTIPMTQPAAVTPKAVGTAATDGPFALCPSDPAKPLTEPEGISLIHADSAASLATGAGVKVGVIADGAANDLPDFKRPDGTPIVTDAPNFTSLSPAFQLGEATADISTIGAQGLVHDLHDTVPSLPAGCNIKLVGVAPGATITQISALGIFTTTADVLESIDYATNVAHDDVINESFGFDSIPNVSARNAIELFDDEAVAAGVTVVVSSGDAGTTGTIDAPATDPNVISVGASTSLRLLAQNGSNGTNGQWANNNIGEFSSSGFTNTGATIDIVAPGYEGWVADPGTSGLATFGGTSESAPYTSGSAALVIEAYRSTHGGASPTPAVVKSLIVGTAQDTGADAQLQGAGLLDTKAAVEAALTYPGGTAAPAGLGSHVIPSATQLNFQGAPGSTQKATETLTNVGAKPVTVAPALRRSVPIATFSDTETLAGDGKPTIIPLNLGYDAVPCDTLRVQVHNDTLYHGNGNIDLYGPGGTLENQGALQGDSFYSTLYANSCTPGTWDVKLPATLSGQATIKVDLFRKVPVGSASPASVTLAPGASHKVTLSVPVPADGGDYGYALTLPDSSGLTNTVPVTVRTVLSLASGSASFHGSVTGGNGRTGHYGNEETAVYAVDVKAGLPVLHSTVSLHVPHIQSDDTADLIKVTLVDPHGETGDEGVAGDGGVVPTVLGATSDPDVFTVDVAKLHPIAGRWTVVVTELGAAQAISEDITGTIDTIAPLSATAKLPDSATKKLAAGKTVTVPVTVTNHTTTDAVVGIDPRTNKMQQIPLAPLTAAGAPSSSRVTLPVYDASFGVPMDTKNLTAIATSSIPSMIDLASPSSALNAFSDLHEAQGGDMIDTASIGEATPTLSPGLWHLGDTPLGAWSYTTATPATVTASATTYGFDRTMTVAANDPSGVGPDPYLPFIDPSLTYDASQGTDIAAGQSLTFNVTITPKGKSGTVVAGTLNILSGVNAKAAELPYTYTVG